MVSSYPGDRRLLPDTGGTVRPAWTVHGVTGTGVVLGRATPLRDCNVAACTADNVPIYRRRGGGGAVVLDPGVVVIAGLMTYDWSAPIDRVLGQLVWRLGETLAAIWPCHVFVPQGLGDLTVDGRKVLGSSLYVGRRLLLYQGSLLVTAQIDRWSHYLPHPSMEPEYRRGRSHADFVRTLSRPGGAVEPALFPRICRRLEDVMDAPAQVLPPVALSSQL